MMETKYSLTDKAIKKLSEMQENEETISGKIALEIAIVLLKNENSENCLSCALNKKFNGVTIQRLNSDYYKGFYDGVNSVLNRKDK